MAQVRSDDETWSSKATTQLAETSTLHAPEIIPVLACPETECFQYVHDTAEENHP